MNKSAIDQGPLATAYVLFENLTQLSDSQRGLSSILSLFVHSYAIWLI